MVVSPTEDAQDGTTYPISWQSEAGTVYGGTVDLVSGVLTVTAIGKVFDGTEDWASYQTSPNRFYRYSLTDIQTSSPINENRACSHFRNATVITSTTSVGFNGYTSSGMNSIWFNFRPDLEEIPDVDAWKAWLAEQYANGTPVQAYCPIITPITYQLTPVEVKTLLGLNNVWADTGDVEVQYRADTKMYIDGKNTDFSKLIAPTEADYKATRAYTSGSLMIVGSQLYKATTSIANGATLTVGTNITATTLAEVIAAL